MLYCICVFLNCICVFLYCGYVLLYCVAVLRCHVAVLRWHVAVLSRCCGYLGQPELVQPRAEFLLQHAVGLFDGLNLKQRLRLRNRNVIKVSAGIHAVQMIRREAVYLLQLVQVTFCLG